MRTLALVAIAVAAPLAAQSAPPLLVGTEWLAARLGEPKVVVLHVSHDAAEFATGHIPGARPMLYNDVIVDRAGIRTELPPPEQLRHTFEKLGVSDDSHVVIYAGGSNMAPMAGRVFLTLDYLGHQRVSLLDGGLAKWRAERRPVVTETPQISPGRLTPRPQPVTVDAAWIMQRLGRTGYSFIDTRTTPEYVGNGTRSGLPSTGHLAGARQLEWEQLFSDPAGGLFRPVEELRTLYAGRVAQGDTVVTYCLVGYRASLTYFAARLLGYPVRLYDGSYQDWARRELPLRAGSSP
jgi:thiosulfate/3-mercaptopyruvate sulfurtransferase